MTLPQPRSARLRHGMIAWREAGDGPPLILLHGIGSNSASWAAQLRHFSPRFRVVAWDAPGYGASDPLREESPTADAYARVLEGLLDAAGIRSCRLVGHSLGALVAVAFAKRRPGRTAAVILAAAASGFGRESVASRNAKIRERLDPLARLGPVAFAAERAPRLLSPRAPAAALATVRDAMAEVRPDGYAAAAHMLANANIFADLPAIRTPVLVVCGDADAITPLETNRKIAAAIKGARFEVLPGVGHACPVEDPAAFNLPVGTFLDSLAGPPS